MLHEVTTCQPSRPLHTLPRAHIQRGVCATQRTAFRVGTAAAEKLLVPRRTGRLYGSTVVRKSVGALASRGCCSEEFQKNFRNAFYRKCCPFCPNDTEQVKRLCSVD